MTQRSRLGESTTLGALASLECEDSSSSDQVELELLAACVRYADRQGWTEGVRSHFSVELSSKKMAVQCEDVCWGSMKSSGRPTLTKMKHLTFFRCLISTPIHYISYSISIFLNFFNCLKTRSIAVT